MSNKEKINLHTVYALIEHAHQYDDDPEELAILFATTTIVLVGLADIEFDKIIDFMNAAYPGLAKANAAIQGHPTTTQ